MVEHHEGDTRVRTYSSSDITRPYLIIEHVDQICIEGVEIVQLGKLGEDEGKLLAEVGLRELDLPHVEAPDPRDLVVPVDDSGSLPLGLREHNVCEVLGSRDHSYLLEVVKRHGDSFYNSVIEPIDGKL